MPFVVIPITGYTDDIPVVFIGGSITDNGQATDAAHGFVDLTCRYIGNNTFYHITKVESGIGGNSSWMNLIRLQTDLIDYNPKIVVIDVAVNNSTSDTDKASTEALIRRIRTALPDAFIVMIYFGNYPGWETNDPTNAKATTKAYLEQLSNLYELLEVDVDDFFNSIVGAGTYTLSQLYYDDEVHPGDLGHSLASGLLIPTIRSLFPIPANPQWSQDLADYTRIFDNGDYENTPIIRTAIDNDGETGTWSVVSTTQKQSSTADSTIVWTGTFQSFGFDTVLQAGAGTIAWKVDDGDYTNMNLSTYPLNNARQWSGTMAEHTVTIKVVSGTVTIKRFLAI